MTPFREIDGATASIAVTTTSARAAIARQPSGAHQLRLHNAGPATAFYRRGDATVAATTSDVPIPSGAIEVITVRNTEAGPQSHLAAIAASGTAALYLTTGAGL